MLCKSVQQESYLVNNESIALFKVTRVQPGQLLLDLRVPVGQSSAEAEGACTYDVDGFVLR